jgi:hypothetical protein
MDPAPRRTRRTEGTARAKNENGPTRAFLGAQAQAKQRLVCDALRGICWADDAQVAPMSGQKVYGEQPRLDVTVTVLK